MKTLKDIEKEINTLPKGNVYEKEIKGNIYYYHQYTFNNRHHSKKISLTEKEYLEPLIEQRKTLENVMRELKKINTNNIKLTNQSRQLTGFIMSGDREVAEFENGVLISVDRDLCPLSIQKSHGIQRFLESRTLDTNRKNNKLLLEKLDIHEEWEPNIPLYNHLRALTDDYWFKPLKSKTKFQHVQFENDRYFMLTLEGDEAFVPVGRKLTPELTIKGHHEKGWRLVNGEWWLYKKENKTEAARELYCVALAKLCHIPVVEYLYKDNYVISKNFAVENNYEPFSAIFKKEATVADRYSFIKRYNDRAAKEYLISFVFDTLINNKRDHDDVGILRNKESGNVICLAPLFDFHAAKIEEISDSNEDDSMKQLLGLLKDNEVKEDLKEFTKIELNEEILETIKLSSEFKVKNIKNVRKNLVNRLNLIKEYIMK